MRGFFSGLVSRRQRGGTPVEYAGERTAENGGRNSRGSSHGSFRCSLPGSPELDIRIDARNSPPWAKPEYVADEGRTQMVGAGNFGVLACSKQDFMQIQSSVMDALCRAEAQFCDDEEFSGALLQGIDLLFDEFEMLKELLMRAHSGDTDAGIERDVLPLKQKLQLGINDIVSRIVERENQPRRRREGSRYRAHPSALDGAGDNAGRGIPTLQVEGLDNHLEVDTPTTRRRVPVTDGTGAVCEALDTLHL